MNPSILSIPGKIGPLILRNRTIRAVTDVQIETAAANWMNTSKCRPINLQD